jgi:hypothetical protein
MFPWCEVDHAAIHEWEIEHDHGNITRDHEIEGIVTDAPKGSIYSAAAYLRLEERRGAAGITFGEQAIEIGTGTDSSTVTPAQAREFAATLYRLADQAEATRVPERVGR